VAGSSCRWGRLHPQHLTVVEKIAPGKTTMRAESGWAVKSPTRLCLRRPRQGSPGGVCPSQSWMLGDDEVGPRDDNGLGEGEEKTRHKKCFMASWYWQ
jgi:hypothetical protein